MDGGAWWAAVHGVTKSQTRLSDFTFTFHFHALEKEMATHSIVLAWRIPGTGEAGRLPSMGLHRVRHDWSVLAAAAAGLKVNGNGIIERKLIFNVEISPKDSDPGEWKLDEVRSCLCVKQSSYSVYFTVFDVTKVNIGFSLVQLLSRVRLFGPHEP